MKSSYFILVLFLFLTIQSCKNPCRNIDCIHGSCNEGHCLCEEGYEQDSTGKCTVAGISKFLGAWNGSEDCSASIYTINIVQNSLDARKVDIYNFADINCTTGNPLVATGVLKRNTSGVYVVDSITTACSSIIFDKSKTHISVSGNKLTAYYYCTIGSNIYNCNVSMSKL